MQLKESGQFSLVIRAPFDCSLTVAKPAGWHWSTPDEVFEKGTLWSGVYLKRRPVGLQMTSDSRQVNVKLYSTFEILQNDLDMLKDCLSTGLGRDEDLSGFYSFAQNDPVLSIAVKDLHGMRAGRLDGVFGRVILAILLQMAPLARSQKMMISILEHYGTKIDFDNRRVIL